MEVSTGSILGFDSGHTATTRSASGFCACCAYCLYFQVFLGSMLRTVLEEFWGSVLRILPALAGFFANSTASTRRTVKYSQILPVYEYLEYEIYREHKCIQISSTIFGRKPRTQRMLSRRRNRSELQLYYSSINMNTCYSSKLLAEGKEALEVLRISYSNARYSSTSYHIGI